MVLAVGRHLGRAGPRGGSSRDILVRFKRDLQV